MASNSQIPWTQFFILYHLGLPFWEWHHAGCSSPCHYSSSLIHSCLPSSSSSMCHYCQDYDPDYLPVALRPVDLLRMKLYMDGYLTNGSTDSSIVRFARREGYIPPRMIKAAPPHKQLTSEPGRSQKQKLGFLWIAWAYGEKRAEKHRQLQQRKSGVSIQSYSRVREPLKYSSAYCECTLARDSVRRVPNNPLWVIDGTGREYMLWY